MKKRSVGLFILIVLIIATVIFIWGNSILSVPKSQAISLGVLARIKPFLGIFFGQDNVTDNLVRKIAHFIEYGVLGCVLILQLVLRRRVRLQPVINCAFAAMVVALTDETIQIFSGRGSQVQDVWRDFAGACTGILLVLIIFGLIKAIRHRKDEIS